MKRIKALLFLESNFCAEKQLLLFFISWGVIRNSEPAAEIVLPMLLFLLWNQERDWLERCVRLKVNLTLLGLLLIIYVLSSVWSYNQDVLGSQWVQSDQKKCLVIFECKNCCCHCDLDLLDLHQNSGDVVTGKRIIVFWFRWRIEVSCWIRLEIRSTKLPSTLFNIDNLSPLMASQEA